jgi:hypothetical protein
MDQLIPLSYLLSASDEALRDYEFKHMTNARNLEKEARAVENEARAIWLQADRERDSANLANWLLRNKSEILSTAAAARWELIPGTVGKSPTLRSSSSLRLFAEASNGAPTDDLGVTGESSQATLGQEEGVDLHAEAPSEDGLKDEGRPYALLLETLNAYRLAKECTWEDLGNLCSTPWTTLHHAINRRRCTDRIAMRIVREVKTKTGLDWRKFLGIMADPE